MSKFKSIRGKQYGYRYNAFRAIRNYEKKYGVQKGKKTLCVNQLDTDCYEII